MSQPGGIPHGADRGSTSVRDDPPAAIPRAVTPVAPAPQADEISLVPLATAVLRHWRSVIFFPLLCAAVAVATSFVQRREFVAAASFMPHAPRTGSPEASLARQFGLDLGARFSAESPQFFADLVRQLVILRPAVETSYQLGPAASARRGTLIDFYGFEVSSSEPAWRKPTEKLREDVSTTVDPETGVTHIAVRASDGELAEQVLARLLELLNAFNLDVQRRRATEEGRFMSGRIEESRGELLGAEQALEEFLNRNREWEQSPTLVFEHDRRQGEVLLRREVYGSLLRSYDQARIEAARDTPVLTVIDAPEDSARLEDRRLAFRALVGAALGLLLALAGAFAAEGIHRSRTAKTELYEDLQPVLADTLYDLKHPGSWFRWRRPPRGVPSPHSTP